jgi:hypothetical protein
MSVFRAANSSTAWPAPADPYDDGPTERLASADSDGPAEPPPRRGVVFAVLLAMLALLVSAGSGLIAWAALGRSDEAIRRASPPAAAPIAAYADEVLRIEAGCGATTLVDLDEPRVNVPGMVGDLRYRSWCEQGTAPQLALGPGAAAGGRPTDAAVDRDGCAEAVRADPLGATTVAAAKGLVLCVLTGPAPTPPSVASPSGISPSAVWSSPTGPAVSTPPETAATAATTEAAPPAAAVAGARMVRVEVVEVAANGTADLRATSWAVR